MRRAALLLVFLLLPTASAAPEPAVATLASTDGDYLIEGRLGGLRQFSPSDPADLRLGLRIEAASLVVEEERQGGVRALGDVAEARAERRSWALEDALVVEEAVRPGRDITILPIDAQVSAAGSGATLSPSTRAVLKAEDRVDTPARDPSVPVGHAVQVDGRPEVVVTGHFVVMLTEMDVTVHGGGTSRTHRAGQEEGVGTATYEPGGTRVPGPTTGNLTEVVLEVRDGTLRLQSGAGRLWFHVTDPTLHAAAIRLDGVTGALPPSLGAATVLDATLGLRGDLRLGLDDTPDGLAWTLHGRLDGAELDGLPVAVVAPLAGGPTARSLLPWSTTLLLLGVAGLPFQRRRARRRLEDAELLLAAGHFQAAADAARPLLLGGLRGPATALRVQALLHAGAADDARRLARAASRRTDPILSRLVQATVDDWEAP